MASWLGHPRGIQKIQLNAVSEKSRSLSLPIHRSNSSSSINISLSTQKGSTSAEQIEGMLAGAMQLCSAKVVQDLKTGYILGILELWHVALLSLFPK